MRKKKTKGFTLNVTVSGDLALGVEDQRYS